MHHISCSLEISYDYLPHLRHLQWESGECQVWLENDYLTENTHVDHVDVGNTLNAILTMCCPHDSDCVGGTMTMYGDSGLSVDLSVYSKHS